MVRDTKDIPQGVLDCFVYDETSPSCLRWKVNTTNGKVKAGETAGCLTKRGYWVVKCRNICYYAHRIVLSLHCGSLTTGMVVDHKDRDKSNNKISNLWLTEWGTNSRNCSKHFDNKYGVTGVSLQKGKGEYLSWVAFVTIPNTATMRRKTFGVNAYGFNSAFDMAVRARAEMIEELRQEGISYSTAHGT